MALSRRKPVAGRIHRYTSGYPGQVSSSSQSTGSLMLITNQTSNPFVNGLRVVYYNNTRIACVYVFL